MERGTLEVARALLEAGFGAVVAAEPGRLVAELEGFGARFVRLPLAAKNPLVVARNVARLEELIGEAGIELVHARSRAPAWSARLAARRRQVPFVTTFHGVYGGAANPLKRRYNAVMAAGAKVIAVSDFVAAHLRAVYGVDEARLRTIPRGVDLAAFDPAAVDDDRRETLRRAWSLPAGARVVLLVGRLTRLKGHRVLVEALGRLSRTDLHAVAAGPLEADSGYVAEVQRLAAATGLGGRLHLVGTVADMPAAYALAEVVVCPSSSEAFGRTSIEAQAMGVPVVLHRVGGLPETVIDGVSGRVVAPGDPAVFADAIAEMLDVADDARAARAEAAMAFVRQRYALSRMLESTLAVYREVLADRNLRV